MHVIGASLLMLRNALGAGSQRALTRVCAHVYVLCMCMKPLVRFSAATPRCFVSHMPQQNDGSKKSPAQRPAAHDVATPSLAANAADRMGSKQPLSRISVSCSRTSSRSASHSLVRAASTCDRMQQRVCQLVEQEWWPFCNQSTCVCMHMCLAVS